jgi:AcrR family transcriptional regulator
MPDRDAITPATTCLHALLSRCRDVNTPSRVMSTTTYESPLRAEQMEQTRLRILEATASVLADEEVNEVTVPVVAMRARVSVRTVYRHFPTKEALFDAFGEWAEEHLRVVVLSYPETLEGVREMAPALYRMYDERAPLIRALLSKRGQEIRARTRRRRMATFGKAMREVTDGLGPAERRRILAVIYLLVSAPAWQAMRDQWELEGQEAGKAAAWAVRVLTDELRRNPASMKESNDDSRR